MRELYVGPRTALEGGTRIFLDLDGREIGVLEHAGVLYAFENRCVHQGGPVCEGRLISKVEDVIDEDGLWRGGRFDGERMHLICPWHGFEFDLRSGECASDRRMRLRRYEVVARGNDVYVKV